MKANESKLLELMRKAHSLEVPIYQRHYAWTKNECRTFYEDIVRAGRSNDCKSYFMGSIVHISDKLSTISAKPPLLIIDGQQRLTTLTLLLAALAHLQKTHTLAPPHPDFSSEQIYDDYLTNKYKDGEDHYKLLLLDDDRSTLIHIIDNNPLPENASKRVKENYEHLKSWLEYDIEHLSIVCDGLLKLMTVDIALARGEDQPQLIFESLNSTGLTLNPSDLMRNYALMGLEKGVQDKIYKDVWNYIDQAFKHCDTKEFNRFMSDYLTIKTQKKIKEDHAYKEFKLFYEKHLNQNHQNNKEAKLKPFMQEIQKYSDYYCNIVFEKEKDEVLNKAFKQFNQLKTPVCNFILLVFYEKYSENKLSRDEFIQIIKWIESYIFRRKICETGANSIKETFLPFIKNNSLQNNILNAFQQYLLNIKGTYPFHTDEEFKTHFITRNIANVSWDKYLFFYLENYQRKDINNINDKKYSLEHIMPQTLTDEWKAALGDDWEDTHKTYLHTIGNLTKIAYNSEYRNAPYSIKRHGRKDKEGNNISLISSTFFLNEDFKSAETWNKNEILKRAERLAERALKIWEYPHLKQEKNNKTLKNIESNNNIKPKFSLESYNLNDKTEILTLKLLNRLEQLNPNIQRIYNKFIIGMNINKHRFLDIEPQKTQLKLFLNMPVHLIYDPKNKTLDLTGKGKMGAGNIAVFFAELNELDDLMNLIIQAFQFNLEKSKRPKK